MLESKLLTDLREAFSTLTKVQVLVAVFLSVLMYYRLIYFRVSIGE